MALSPTSGPRRWSSASRSVLAAELVEVFDGSGILWEECGSGFDGAYRAFRFVVEGSLAGVGVSRAFHAIEEGQGLRIEIGQRLIDDGVVRCDEDDAASGEKQAENEGEQGAGTARAKVEGRVVTNEGLEITTQRAASCLRQVLRIGRASALTALTAGAWRVRNSWHADVDDGLKLRRKGVTPRRGSLWK